MRFRFHRSSASSLARRFAIRLALSIVPAGVVIAGVEETVSARLESSTVAIGSSVPIIVEVAGEGAVDPELMDLPRVDGLALELESGPTMEAGGGGLVARFVILARALEPGEKHIPGLSVRVRSDEVLRTDPLRILVVEGEGDAIEFAIVPSADTVFANEPFDLVFRIERPSDSAPTMSRTLRLPWWNRVIVLDGLPGLGPQHEVFEVEDRGQRVLFAPTESAGERTILEARLPLLSPESGVLDFSGSVMRFDPRPTKPYSESIDGGPREEVVARPSRITILPWPKGAPASFVDAVGDFALSAEVDRTRAGVGELIRFAIHVRAVLGRRTNLRTANFAAPLTLDGFRVYSRRDERSADSLILRFEIAATRPGLDSIPASTFAWFDPERREYATATLAPTPIVIARLGDGPMDSDPPDADESGAIDWRTKALIGFGFVLAVLFARRLSRAGDTKSSEPGTDASARADREAARDRVLRASDPFAAETARDIANALTHRHHLRGNACFDASIAAELEAAGVQSEIAGLVARYFARVEEAGYSAVFVERADDRELFAAVVRFAFD